MPSADAPRGGVVFAFRALRHRNYRLFFTGQLISLIGTWITRLATGWLVYKLTESAFLLGVVSFAGLIPTFLLTPLGGVLADRRSRHGILLVTQACLMAISFTLAWCAIQGVIDVPHLIVLCTLQGVCNAFDIPARQAFVVDMVEDRADLSSAIALNSMIFNGARLLGPSVAGVLVALFGEGLCFLIDGFSFLGVLAALLAMRVPPRTPREKPTHVLHDLGEGFRASFGFAPIRSLMLLLALTSLVGMPYIVLMPIFADRILGGDAILLGFLMAATGIGALIGAWYLALRRSVLGLGRVIAACGIAFGVVLILFGVSRIVWISLVILIVAGFAMMVQNAASNTIVQTLVDDNKRGRVMSFFAMAFMGTMPFGSLLAGTLAKHIGAPLTVILGGNICLLGSLVFLLRLPRLKPLVRPIYVARGIMPPIPEGVGSTAGLVSPNGDSRGAQAGETQ